MMEGTRSRGKTRRSGGEKQKTKEMPAVNQRQPGASLRQSYAQETVVAHATNEPSSLRTGSGRLADSQTIRDAAFDDWAARKMARSSMRLMEEKRAEPRQVNRIEGNKGEAVFLKGKDGSTVVKESAWADSSSMRQAIYEQWLMEKKVAEKKEKKELISKKKMEEEENKVKLIERGIDSKKSFEAWSSAKEVELKKKAIEKKKAEREKEREKSEEKESRKQDVVTSFSAWKGKKDEKLKEKQIAEVTKKKKTAKEKEEEIEEKQKDSQKSFQNWAEKKGEKLKETAVSKRRAAKEEAKEAERLRLERKTMSETAFEKWKERKESDVVKSTDSSPSSSLGSRLAWCPAGVGIGGVLRTRALPVYARPPSPQQKQHKPRKKKSVQVCCQTLEYWCHCEESN